MMLYACVEDVSFPLNQLFKRNIMDSINKDQNSEQNEKHTGGSHIFIALGVALVVIVLFKFLLDWLMK